MNIGMVGLGRMGANMAARLARGGHRVAGFDPGAAAREAAQQAHGLETFDSLAALVAAHGGRVGVDSTPGAGATFWVRLPRLDD